MIYKIEFENYITEIEEDGELPDVFDVDFGGCMMIRFEKVNGKIIATNGMNGYGDNIADEIKDKEPIITKI